MIMIKWKRKCPKCKKEITYSRKDSKNRAEKQNTNCKACAKSGENNYWYGKKEKDNPNFGRIWNKGLTKETDYRIKKISESKKGINHPFYGKKRSEETCKKISESNKGQIRSEKIRKNISEGKKGKKRKPFSNKHRKNQRLSKLKNIENRCGQVIPNYNPSAILIMLEKAKEFGIDDLQHAENGGEFQVCGYFVDGYSPSKNVVIEYYEKAHKYQKERDERRKQEIIKELGCKFIEIKEKQ